MRKTLSGNSRVENTGGFPCTISQCPCTSLTASKCLSLELGNGTVNGLLKIVRNRHRSHEPSMHCGLSGFTVDEASLNQTSQAQKWDASSYHTDRSVATRLWPCNNLGVFSTFTRADACGVLWEAEVLQFIFYKISRMHLEIAIIDFKRSLNAFRDTVNTWDISQNRILLKRKWFIYICNWIIDMPIQ